MTKFKELGLNDEILKSLEEMGFEEVFPIQEACIPVLLSSRDVIGQAHTGSGKTAAFALAMLQQITPKKGIQGMVIAPTRELAMQISVEIKKFAKYTGIRTATVYGGQGMGIQLDALHRGVEIIVATPGRLIDMLERKVLKLDQIHRVILDEADEMLNMGFKEDIYNILSYTPKEKRIWLLSATMAGEIKKITRNLSRLTVRFLNNRTRLILDKSTLKIDGCNKSF